MKWLLALVLIAQVKGPLYHKETFSAAPLGSFRQLKLPGVTIEAEPNDLAFVTSEIGGRSIYTNGALTITFNPPVLGASLDVNAYRSGQPMWECDLVKLDGAPAIGVSIGDTMGVILNYPQWGPLWAFPIGYKLSKCVVQSDSGLFIDNLVKEL